MPLRVLHNGVPVGILQDHPVAVAILEGDALSVPIGIERLYRGGIVQILVRLGGCHGPAFIAGIVLSCLSCFVVFIGCIAIRMRNRRISLTIITSIPFGIYVITME